MSGRAEALVLPATRESSSVFLGLPRRGSSAPFHPNSGPGSGSFSHKRPCAQGYPALLHRAGILCGSLRALSSSLPAAPAPCTPPLLLPHRAAPAGYQQQQQQQCHHHHHHHHHQQQAAAAAAAAAAARAGNGHPTKHVAQGDLQGHGRHGRRGQRAGGRRARRQRRRRRHDARHGLHWQAVAHLYQVPAQHEKKKEEEVKKKKKKRRGLVHARERTKSEDSAMARGRPDAPASHVREPSTSAR